jgi:outer membrane lipoprotein-sorting protein
MRKSWLKLSALLLPVATGCLSHTRKLDQPELIPVIKPDVAQLIEIINQRYQQVSSLTATLDFAVSVSGPGRSEWTDYTTCSGYLLFRKPYMLRVLVLVPVLHTRALDLVSDGTTFTLFIPPKNRAIEGKNTVTKISVNPLENLRPNVFLDTFLVHDIAPSEIVSVIQERTMKENGQTKRLMELPEYDLTVFDDVPRSAHSAPVQIAKPQRVIRFAQGDLLPIGQDIYDANGNLETEVVYGPYRDFGGIAFPSTIDIDRPFEGYRIRLTVSKLAVNQAVTDDTFELKIPKAIQVEKVE